MFTVLNSQYMVLRGSSRQAADGLHYDIEAVNAQQQPYEIDMRQTPDGWEIVEAKPATRPVDVPLPPGVFQALKDYAVLGGSRREASGGVHYTVRARNAEQQTLTIDVREANGRFEVLQVTPAT